MADPPPLDPGALAVLKENFEDSPEVLDAVIDDFLESVTRLHARIRTAIASGDATDMSHAAHSLKSNCATLGATVMADVMAGIEKTARQGDIEDCAERLARSEALFIKVRPLIEDLRGTS